MSGSLDLDKIEYLKRDALMCGVPYGEIDVDRLLNSLVLVDEPTDGPSRRGRAARRASPRSSRCCSRSTRCTGTCTGTTRCAARPRCTSGSSMRRSPPATSMRGALSTFDDEGLLHRLGQRGTSPLLSALRERRLYKRVLECPAAELEDDALAWIADDRASTIAIEDRLAARARPRAGRAAARLSRQDARCSASTSRWSGGPARFVA